jgi:hypothetical protein
VISGKGGTDLVPATGEDAVHVVGIGDAGAALEAVKVFLALELATCLSTGDGLDVILGLDTLRRPRRVDAVGRGERELRADTARERENEEGFEI